MAFCRHGGRAPQRLARALISPPGFSDRTEMEMPSSHIEDRLTYLLQTRSPFHTQAIESRKGDHPHRKQCPQMWPVLWGKECDALAPANLEVEVVISARVVVQTRLHSPSADPQADSCWCRSSCKPQEGLLVCVKLGPKSRHLWIGLPVHK